MRSDSASVSREGAQFQKRTRSPRPGQTLHVFPIPDSLSTKFLRSQIEILDDTWTKHGSGSMSELGMCNLHENVLCSLVSWGLGDEDVQDSARDCVSGH